MFRHLSLCMLLLTVLPASPAQIAGPVNESLSALGRRGINVSLSFYSDTLIGQPASSSVPHAGAFQFLDLSADLDFDRLISHLRLTRLHTSFHVNGRGGGDFDGAYQSMIGITSPAGARIAELWLEHRQGKLLLIRAGKIDANPDFAVVNNGAGFLNASFSYDPTFLTLPNYSNTAWGAELLLRHRHLHLNVAAFRPSQGTGALLMEEAGLAWEPHGWSGRAAVGAWQQTGTLPSLSGTNEKGARGYYIIGEQKFWKQVRNQGEPERALSGFLQLGSAPSRFSMIEQHFGAGVVLSSPLASRAEDSAGVSVTHGRLTQDPAAAFDYRYETVLEVTYTFKLRAALSISPDVQYAIHPGGISNNRNALAAGARIIFTMQPQSE